MTTPSTPDSKESELLPCPFCGSPAQTAYEDDFNFYQCSNYKCAASNLVMIKSEWNTRYVFL
jgi:hypothetical protein